MLLLLMLVYFVLSLDRQIIAVVIEPLKREFGLSDGRVAFVGSFGPAIAFSIACLPIGRMIDRINRMRLLAALLAIWSAFTATGGFVRGYVPLLIARMGVNGAEAGGAPTVMSYISDILPETRRSSAIGFFYFGTAAGVAASFFVGSAVAAAFGWRAAFLLAGMPGLFLAGTILVVLKDPTRNVPDALVGIRSVGRVPLVDAARGILTNAALLHLAAGITLGGFVAGTLWTWVTSFLIRYQGMHLADAGRLVAIAAIFQAGGAFVGGRVSDRITRVRSEGPALVAAACVLIMVPIGLGMLFAPSWGASAFLLCAFAFFNGAWMGPGFALTMTVVKPQIRGVVAAFVQLLVNLIGAGAGPLVAGLISDGLGQHLREAVACCFCANLWGALHFYFAACRRRSSSSSSSAKLYVFSKAGNIDTVEQARDN